MRLIVVTSCLVLLAVLLHTDHVTAAPGGAKGKQKGGARNIGSKDSDSKSGESSEEFSNNAPVVSGEKAGAPAPKEAAVAPAPQEAVAPAPEGAAADPASAADPVEPEQEQEPPPFRK